MNINMCLFEFYLKKKKFAEFYRFYQTISIPYITVLLLCHSPYTLTEAHKYELHLTEAPGS